MKRPVFRLLVLLLALAMMPGAAELFESAVHLVSEGHVAHAVPESGSESDAHHPEGPEHGCTPTFHLCGCHASLAFVGPVGVPVTVFQPLIFQADPISLRQASGFGPVVERPPQG